MASLAAVTFDSASAESLLAVDDPKAAGAISSVTDPVFDRIWGLANIYDNPENSILEKVAFRGRFQVDFPIFESDQGEYRDPQIRRLRLGLKTSWQFDLTAHVEVDIDSHCSDGEVCDDDVYEGLTDAYVGWSPSEAFRVKIGKISAGFTLDGSTSSNNLITLERNNVSNNIWFPAEYHLGGSISGRLDNWHYQAGAFSSSTGDEWGTNGGAAFMLLRLGYDFSKTLDASEALVAFDYVFNEPDDNNLSTRSLAHIFSSRFRYDNETWGLRADLSGALGYGGQSDLLGLVIMPFYHVTERIQVVGRYTYLLSFQPNGVRLSRYENRIETGTGDEFNEFFAGLNWFVYGSKFKLQTGIKYTMMDDEENDGGEYRGWGWTMGIRMSW
jgi:phosphate-selective porin OprO/OprP